MKINIIILLALIIGSVGTEDAVSSLRFKPLQKTFIDTLETNKWKTIDLKDKSNEIAPWTLMKESQNNKGIATAGISQIMIFKPEQISSKKKPIVIIGTHGTYAPKAAGFSDPEDVYFQGVRNFAEQEAIRKQTPVIIVSFVWNAENWTKDRVNAGEALAKIVDAYFSQDCSLYFVSHSHGCNVVNIATHKFSNKAIADLIVHYASPIREKDSVCQTNACEDLYVPINFKKLLSFYSLHDFVQVGGAVTTKITNMLGSFWRALSGSSELRKYVQAHKGDEYVYNISTKVNSDFPSHSAIVVVSWFLPAILSRLETYKCHDDLIVNVDTEAKEGSVTLAINEVDSINNDTCPSKSKQQLEEETDFSDQEAEKYKALYNENITDEKGLTRKAWDMTVNMVKLLDDKTLVATKPATKS